ncbi:MAG: TRAP transporter small permease, partial [Candidatus Methylomirabilales bacterium]
MGKPRGVGRLIAFGRRAEDALTVAALLTMGILPVLEMVLRTLFHTGIPGTSGYVQNLTLWVGFLGAMIASRERRHLNLSTGMVLPPKLQGIATILAATASTAVASGLFWASLQFVRVEMESPANIAGWLPIWVAEAILPISFAVITLRFVVHAGGWKDRVLASLGIPAAVVIGFLLESHAPQ